MGTTWCLITSGFWGDLITLVGRFLFNTPLNDFTYFLITIGLLPIAHVTWMSAIAQFFFKEVKQKIMGLIFLIEAIVFEILFLYFLIVEPSIIGTLVPISHIEWGIFTIFYFLFSMLLFLLTGIMFTLQCFKSPEPETRSKGKFLFFAFISFTIGIIVEIIPVLFEFKYVLSRLIIFSASFEFYMGFTLSTKIENLE